ncbi:MAG: dTDP-4-dehydrorhamnose reductase [Planctomycetes bacterium]|nr:dTDP-4-dehydrorhamnose reductase [Planctomycetota bacterium]
MQNNTKTKNIKSLLIIGAQGMLGRQLVDTLTQDQWRRTFDSCAIHECDIHEVDITEPHSVRRCFDMFSPELVINCAAYTNVDDCETHCRDAFAVNADGPLHLAQNCQKHHAKLIHVSTDFVFGGHGERPYLPDDPTGPISVYGKSKLAGEQAIQKNLPDHAIVRTSWLFGKYGNNFIATICRLAEQRDHLEIVNDQIGSPTYAVDLAQALLHLAVADARGIFHFCNQGYCSWFDFAREIVKIFNLKTNVQPINSEKLKRPAPRPKWSVMDTDKYRHITNQPIRSWQNALKHYSNNF